MPRWAPVFQGLISLDFASHYVHMYAMLATVGEKAGGSHKDVSGEESRILKIYYSKVWCFSCLLYNSRDLLFC